MRALKLSKLEWLSLSGLVIRYTIFIFSRCCVICNVSDFCDSLHRLDELAVAAGWYFFWVYWGVVGGWVGWVWEEGQLLDC